MRLLPIRSEVGYTDRLDRAMRDEPEAVPESYQAQLTLDAQRRDREQRVHGVARGAPDDQGRTATFTTSCRVDGSLRGALRAIERQVKAFDQRVAR